MKLHGKYLLLLLVGFILVCLLSAGCKLMQYTFNPGSTATPAIAERPLPTWTIRASTAPTLTLTATASPVPTATPPPIPTFTSPPTDTFTPSPEPATCVPGNTQTDYGFVQRINDNDTMVVDIRGHIYTVQYLGIVVPQNGASVEFMGPEAAAKIAEWVTNRVIRLVADAPETGLYGQLLRYVFVEDVFINYELVRSGLARSSTDYPGIACAATLLNAEQLAQQSGAGLWAANPNPTGLPTATIAYWLTKTPNPNKFPPRLGPPTATHTHPPPTRTSPPTVTSNAVCSCTGDLYNCKDFSTQAKAQQCFNLCLSLGKGDIHKLDPDQDGMACEELP